MFVLYEMQCWSSGVVLTLDWSRTSVDFLILIE
jgi:hypothetical protein